MGKRTSQKKPLAYQLKPYVNLRILLTVFFLIAIGLIMMTSASMDVAETKNASDSLFYLKRQLVFFLIGITLVIFIYQIKLEYIERNALLMLFLSIFLLVIVLLPGIGKSANNAQRWLSLGPYSFQPSELVKIFFIIYLSSYISRYKENIQQHFSAFIKPILLVSILALLLLLEPDFGTMILILCITTGMLFLAGAKVWHFLILFSIGTPIILYMIQAPYRWNRLTAFLDPWQDQYDTGYQLVNSLIAIGSGGIFGLGLGNSIQKLGFLPEPHTDFIFAITAEELGLLGAIFVILLYLIFFFESFKLAKEAQRLEKHFASFLAFGISIWFVLQAFINIGVNIGLLPTKGLTLPLMSYGGSSFVVALCAIGFLLRIHRENYLTYLSRPVSRRRN
ncbi:MAG: putative lipid II flippase FtsW [Pseudomonadota bacterium]